MNEFLERKVHLTWGEQKPTYDVVVIGGGGHGLSTAYHLATRHGITNVAVLERKYIGGGNSGRNTTVIRSNYGVPESIRFYQRSVELYQQLEEETDRWIMHKQKGILWTVHTEAGLRQERARSFINQANGVNTEFLTPQEIAGIAPEIDLNVGGGKYPVLGASYQAAASTARHDRV
ncbi:MAG: FAD-binding oxidoreductase, partial [Acidimicrobiia bacterium]|nr:FAD-binding oxidoreductase [Acidimicrobiia bacterium]